MPLLIGSDAFTLLGSSQALEPFDVVPLGNATVIWGDASEDWHRYGLTVGDPAAAGTHSSDEAREVAYADRYGGAGLRDNGGSARCGIVDGYQIKGIGPTPLLGQRMTYEHRHGRMTLVEAIEEAVWGEILTSALPHGALRTRAVISSGLSHKPTLNVDAQRSGLVVRDVVLRPAHFMRALYHRTFNAEGHRTFIDTDRVRRAITLLPKALPRHREVNEVEWIALPERRRLTLGLCEWVWRMAEQSAASKARRLLHGAVSPSNMGLDGAWLDYGSVSVSPNFCNHRHFNPGFWDDGRRYLALLSDLCFYIEKYFPFETPVVHKDELVASFQDRYEYSLRQEFCALAGLFGEVAGQREGQLLGEVVVRLARLGAAGDLPERADELREANQYRLRDVLPWLASRMCAAESDAALESLGCWVPDAALRDRLLRAYAPAAALECHRIERTGLSSNAAQRLIWLRSMAATATVPSLYPHHLRRDVSELIASSRDPIVAEELRTGVTKLIDSRLRQARMAFSRPDGAASTLYLSDDEAIRFDSSRDGLVVERSAGAALPIGNSSELATIIGAADGNDANRWQSQCEMVVQ